MFSKKPARGHPSIHWLIVFAAFSAAVAVIFFQNDAFYRDFQAYFRMSAQPPVARRHAVRLTIDFGNGQKRAFEGAPDPGMTVLSTLRLSGEAGRFDVATDGDGVITAIAGVKSRAGKRWVAYANGRPIDDLPGHSEVGPGDRIELRYE